MNAILVLEDDETIREVICEYLRLSEYHVTETDNGISAMEMLKSENFSVAILDILVPHASGLEVLEYIRKMNIPTSCIMLSALGDEQTQLHAFESFADDYIIKPFSPRLLLKRVEVVMRRRQTISEQEFAGPNISHRKGEGQSDSAIDGLEIDRNMYQAYWLGKSLYLTLTEYLLLDCFLSSPRQVFTREQLLDRIAPDDFMVNDRVIDAHIKNLRKKCPNPWIKTVIGVGYCLNHL